MLMFNHLEEELFEIIKARLEETIPTFGTNIENSVLDFEVSLNTGWNHNINAELVAGEIERNVYPVTVAKIKLVRMEDTCPDPVPPGYWGTDIVSYFKVHIVF